MKIKIFTVGGTIDKVYFDKKSKYQVGDPTIVDILQEANVTIAYECVSVLKKDSLDMTDGDRQLLFDAVQRDPCDHILITHGTDSLVGTAKKLTGIPKKVIVLTGAIEPARSKSSDAPFNIGSAVAAVQLLSPGVYIVMNGRVFDPGNVKKDLERNLFVDNHE